MGFVFGEIHVEDKNLNCLLMFLGYTWTYFFFFFDW